MTAFACGLAAGLASLYGRRKAAAETRTPTTLAWALAAIYLVVFVTLAVGRFYNLAYWGWDLGEYASVAYNTAHGRAFTHTFRGAVCYFDHFAPLLFVISPLTYVFREPVYLVVIIATSAAASVILVYFLAAARGARWPAFALAASYALSPYLHGATLYENPLRAMAAPLVLAALLSFVRGRFGWGAFFTAFAATASEEMAVYAVVVAALGAALCRRRRAGVLLTVALAVYAGVICFYVYPKAVWGEPRLPNLAAYMDRVREGGLLTLFEAKGVVPLHTRLWYAATMLGPLAVFLPFAGISLILLLAPLYVFLTVDNPSICTIGFGFPFQFLPFAYAAAAFGLARVTALRRAGLRRFLLAAASVTAVSFQLASIAFSHRTWYAAVVADLFPKHHKIGALAGIRKIPPGVAVSADQPAFTLAAQRPVATLYPHGLGLDYLKKVDAVFLDRDFHPARGFPSDAARLRAAGFYPADVTRDYAYFTRRPGKFSFDDVWRAWYGVISESHFHAAGRCARPRRDPRAPDDGVALRFARDGFLLERERYFFPPGRYNFVFLLACEEGEFCHVVARVIFRDPRTGAARRDIYKCWTLNADGEFHGYRAKFKIGKPAVVEIGLAGTAPFNLDGVVVEGNNYNLEKAARYCPWPLVPRNTRPGGTRR
ncbi:MAG: DUF2079 domain-containing protein [candidate division Zixibacteria bacterium]|nr:DUF2079 domain-containing protein [candidate division Zixibacteria bacterium]